MVNETQLKTYRNTLMNIWGQGAPTLSVLRDLETLKRKMNIPDEIQQKIESEILNDVSDEYRYKTYKVVLEEAWSDDIISDDVEAIISRLKTVLSITNEEHRILENQVKKTLMEGGEPLARRVVNQQDAGRQPVQPRSNTRVKVKQPIPRQGHPPEPNVRPPEGDADFWLTQGEQVFTNSNGDLKKIETAIEFFNKAIEIEPLNFLAWSNKGLGLKILNRFDNALMCYERALTFAPDHINTWFNKAVLLGCMNRYEEAAMCYKQVLELDPYHELALRDLNIIVQYLKQQ